MLRKSNVKELPFHVIEITMISLTYLVKCSKLIVSQIICI